MPERIVVSFCESGWGDPGMDRRFLDRAVALALRAEALGATVCAFGAHSFAFDFGVEELEEAVSLAVGQATGASSSEEQLGVGLSQGSLVRAGSIGALSTLSWGEPLLRAESFARVAHPGEVLVDPLLPALRSGELLVTGKRTGEDRGRRVSAWKLDTFQPWRLGAVEAMARLEEPEVVGRQAELEALVVPVGCIGVIHADRGMGGSRLLVEAMAHLDPSRTLFVAPAGASCEPLGALRNALSRSAALRGAPRLPERLYDALDRLLAGRGTDLWLASELIDRWLSPVEGRFGALAIDDATEVDVASLEAIAGGIHHKGAFRALARIPADAELPAALQTVPVGARVVADRLDPQAAAELARRFLGGAIGADAARRWARRGAGAPLGIREALADSLSSGELAFHGSVAQPRGRLRGRGKPRDAAVWIERRARWLSAGPRASLLALCMLGGDGSVALIDALATRIEGPAAVMAAVGASLVSGHWIVSPEPGWMKLTSRTIRDVLLGSLDEDARMLWHSETARILEQHGGVLGRADAAWHAAQASASRAAAKFALEAARASLAASLDSAAAALHQFAREHDPEVAAVLAPPSLPPSIPTVTPTIPPPTLPGSQRGAGMDGDTLDQPLDPVINERLGRAAGELAPALGGGVPVDMADVPLSMRTGAAPVSVHLSVVDSEGTDPEQLAMHLVELAKQALLQGDVVSLERLILELRVTGEHSELVERMSGFVALNRGAKEEALGKLRMAAEVSEPPAKAARARLAYAVALAHAGRTESAVLSALEALAFARRGKDRHGERVCARFLVGVCLAAGHPQAAAAWAKVAKGATTVGSG